MTTQTRIYDFLSLCEGCSDNHREAGSKFCGPCNAEADRVQAEIEGLHAELRREPDPRDPLPHGNETVCAECVGLDEDAEQHDFARKTAEW